MPAVTEPESQVEEAGDEEVDESLLLDETGMLEEPVPELDEDAIMEEEVPQELTDAELTFEESCVVVRQGQLYIELQHRSPPMKDMALQAFCDWLDTQLPVSWWLSKILLIHLFIQKLDNFCLHYMALGRI
jgi:hypothetical protein